MKKLLLTLVISLVTSYQASAQSMFKCTDNSFVHTSDSSSKVRAKCGYPIFKDYSTSGEVWVYAHPDTNRGAELQFRNGKLVNIKDIGEMAN
jgi:hypothetical protein